jgi:hypothetical protein
LSFEEQLCIDAERWLKQLTKACAKPNLSKRMVKVKGREQELCDWRRASEIANHELGKASLSRIAEAYSRLTGKAATKPVAQNRLDLIAELMAPGDDWDE